MNSIHNHTNRLIDSTSPYLLQHAHNPVDWFPWGTEAWDLAKAENKLVVVSIGYSACHWCHVMEHESFETDAVAEVMNRSFVSIKVDREERPDVDMVYMDACQVMTGRGGWPLNVICLPDGRPVYAGTYFKKDQWTDILGQLSTLWQNQPESAMEYGARIVSALRELNQVEGSGGKGLGPAEMMEVFETFFRSMDPVDGGLNQSQKFPMPVNFAYLLDYWIVKGDERAREHLHLTLLKMAHGGIYDHLRGGFYRYSTDRKWFAPHFEKMLYDNAQLISLYSRAGAIFDVPLYHQIATESLNFCVSELRAEGGGYYAALDADSEGTEGRYYVFTYNELKEILSPDELSFCAVYFGTTESGNWEKGFNILHKPNAPLQVIEKLKTDVATYQKSEKTLKAKLRQYQNQRQRPGLDNKIIASWNGLMLKALADAASYTSRTAWISEAIHLGNWIWDNLQMNGQVYRTTGSPDHRIHGFAEDYAAIILGYIALYEADGGAQWIQRAETLLKSAVREFFNHETMVFQFGPESGEELIVSKSDITDGVIPSSNSMLCEACIKLGLITGETKYSDIGNHLLEMHTEKVLNQPAWHANWARMALAGVSGMLQVCCAGINGLETVSVLKRLAPSGSVFVCDEKSTLPILNDKTAKSPTTIYLCKGHTCLEPVDSIEKAAEILRDILGTEQAY